MHAPGPFYLVPEDDDDAEEAVALVFGDDSDDDDDELHCELCHGKGDEAQMLLCDDCNKGFHTFCLQPPLSAIPAGDWWCRSCRNLTITDPLVKRTARVRVFWEDYQQYFEGEVQSVRRARDGSRHHLVYYGPGDEQWQPLVAQLEAGKVCSEV